MDRTLQKLKIILWKNYIIRKRHYFELFFEIFLPAGLFYLVALVRKEQSGLIPNSATVIDETTYYPLRTGDEIMSRFSGGKRIFYSPSNPFTDLLIAKIRKKFQLSEDRITKFDSEEELLKYVNERSLVNFTQVEDVFAIVMNNVDKATKPPKQFNYKIRSADAGLATTLLFPEFVLPGPMHSHENYFGTGFLALQYAINTAYLEILNFGETSDAKLPIDITMQEFPYPPYTEDTNFMTMFGTALPLVTMYSFIMLCQTLLKHIVEEKFTGVKELMKMMGLKSWMLWVGWLLHSLAANVVSVTIIALLLKEPWEEETKVVIPLSNSFLIWTFIFLYCTASIFFCFALSTLFNKPTIALSAGLLIWALTYYIPDAIIGKKHGTSFTVKLLLCLFPNTAINLGFKSIATFEGRDVGLQWSNLFKSASGLSDDVTMGCVFIMLIVDMIFYLVITWYMDAVKPGTYGLAKPWYFPITYCFNTKVQDSNDISSSEQKNFEDPPAGIEAGIKVRNLRKVFGTKVVVDGLNIDFYKGQITALLGHNGAGKTTTVSILTGMISATSGSVSVDGHDVATQLDKVRDSLGLCPQQNMLFIDLTVMEHLVFFAMLKGLTKSEAKTDALHLLDQFNLKEKQNARTEALSGGMKRKLALGISLIGKSKVLMLDEPTSGLDPEARREIWNILLRLRMDRTVIITTHFMEEADVLGDRIAIMDHGQLQCYGTSLYLKKLYGAGYQLSLMKTPDCSIDKLTSVIKSYINEAQLKNISGACVNYALPTAKSYDFPKLFQAIENQKGNLGIKSIGVSITTLEEVFLRVGKLAEEYKDGKEHKDDDNFDMSETASDAGSVEAMRRNKCQGWRLASRRFLALFNKRRTFTLRRWIFFSLQSLTPIAVLLLVIYSSKTDDSTVKEPELNLDLNIYGRTEVLYSSDAKTRKMADFYSKLSQSSDFIDVSPNITAGLLKKSQENIANYRLGMIVAGDFYSDAEQTANAMFSSIALHAAPVSLNMLSNAILKTYKGDDYSITASNHPLDRSNSEISRAEGSVSIILLWYLLMPIGLLFLITGFITYPILERVSSAKQLQLMTGVSAPNYWLACFSWDFMQYMLIAVIMFFLLLIFDHNGLFGHFHEASLFFLMLILYGASGIPCVYVFSYFRDTTYGGFSLALMLNMLLGTVFPPIVIIFRTSDSFYQKLSTIINNIGMLIPHYDICYSLFSFSVRTTESARCLNMEPNLRKLICDFAGTSEVCCKLCDGRTPCSERFSYFSGEYDLTYPFIMFFVDMLLYFALIIFFMETCHPKRAWEWLLHKIYKKKNTQTELDDDVKKEKDRVDGVIRGDASDILLVQNLKKRYKGKFTVVRGISFGVHRGECFGLLGVNGAGKTTTFKMLTGVEPPTKGDACIETMCLKTKKKMFLSQLGYCPQFDAFNEFLTGKEVLEVFARIRGIQEADVRKEVNKWLNILGLREYKDAMSGTLSGGNKRKLSTALALIGDPPIILLDEPTSGVDPVARRNLWDVLTNVQKSGQSIVLTSHSMDECDALCNRLAIMVRGQLMCLGETQYLKERFGQGYTIMLKLSNTATEAEINDLRTEFEKKYDSELKDQHQGLLHYHIKNLHLNWSELFTSLENMKQKYSSVIEDYTVSETTLEEVFLSFARKQDDSENQQS